MANDAWTSIVDLGVKALMTHKITVLFVEDDPGIRRVLPELLPHEEFTSIVCDGGDDAMRILDHEHVDVLLTDVVMPGKNGVELATEAMDRHPDLHVVLMTGYLSRAEEAERVGPLLYKPVRPDEIEDAIRKALAEPPKPH